MFLANPYFNSEEISIYIHWAFCLKKCPYCDFNTFVVNDVDHKKWQKAYLKQIENQKHFFKGKKIKSIFFGGGTPSLMKSEMIYDIINYFTKVNQGEAIKEITLEANPSTFESEIFKDFKEAGINRLSIGVQSFSDDNLQFLGRIHNAKEAIKALEIANNIFPRVSFDLIMGLPNQSLKNWQQDLKRALVFFKEHISIYQLTIEEGTPFFKNKIQTSNEIVSEKMYLETLNTLAKNNIISYEISNFSYKDAESIHNLNYWQGGAYIGIGAGAHGRIYHSNKWFGTIEEKSPNKYLKLCEENKITYSLEEISYNERMEEVIMMFLRLNQAIPNFIIEYLSKEKLQKVIEEKLIFITEDNKYYVSSKGKLCLNYLIYLLLI